MKIHRLYQKQILDVSLAEAWRFFSNPQNLSRITPPQMNFVIKTPIEDNTYAGQIIEYSVTPIFNWSTTWVTEITHINEPFLFVDEQRFGPYKFWHHQHKFKQIDSQVLMEDLIHYSLPLFPFGEIFSGLVSKQLKGIFEYRTIALANFEKLLNEGS